MIADTTEALADSSSQGLHTDRANGPHHIPAPARSKNVSDQTSNRPLKPTDRVKLAAHLVPHFDGETHGIVEAVVGTKYQDTRVSVGGRVYWVAATDLTLDSGNTFTSGQSVRALTGNHAGKVGRIDGDPTSDGWYLVQFGGIITRGPFGRYPAHELEAVVVESTTAVTDVVDVYSCPHLGCDYVAGAAGPVDPDDDYDEFAEEVAAHKRSHERPVVAEGWEDVSPVLLWFGLRNDFPELFDPLAEVARRMPPTTVARVLRAVASLLDGAK